MNFAVITNVIIKRVHCNNIVKDFVSEVVLIKHDAVNEISCICFLLIMFVQSWGAKQ